MHTRITILNAATCNTQRDESARRRIGNPMRSLRTDGQSSNADSPTPMEIGNLRIKKLTPAESQICMKEGRCLCCCEKEYTANKCLKSRGAE